MRTTIYHNPHCTKSRQTLALLEQRGLNPTVVEYLKTPPDGATLRRVLALLGVGPRALLRTGESVYRELGLDAQDKTEDELLAAMVEHPILIERPIVVVDGRRAAIGRPPENVLDIL